MHNPDGNPIIITELDRENFEDWIEPQKLTFGSNRRWRGEGPDHRPYEYQNEATEFAWQAYGEALMLERIDKQFKKTHEGDIAQQEAEHSEDNLHDGDFTEDPL